MKIRFFGDSWYWTWNHKNLEGSVQYQLSSKSLKNSYDVKYLTVKHYDGTQLTKLAYTGIPLIEYILTYYGYKCINYCITGNTFYTVTHQICDVELVDDIKYNVVLYPSLFRHTEQLKIYDNTNYNTFMDKYNTDTINCIQRINDWAKSNNQQVFFIGCQSTLHKSIFDQARKTNNIHLLAECVISKLYGLPNTLGIFKFANDFAPRVDRSWHKRLVEDIHGQMKEAYSIVKVGNHNVPDENHLNERGCLFLTDMILAKIEELEGEKHESNSME